MKIGQPSLVVLVALAFLATPLAAAAQQASKVPRIGFLSWAGPGGKGLADAFLQGLRERGYVEGRSLAVEYRDGTMDRLPDLAAELVRLKVDAIVAAGTPAAIAAKQATSTIPIVMMVVADPVGSGLVASLARTGGNVTGPSMFAPEVFPKELELLKEAVPGVSRVAVLMDPTNPSHVPLKSELDGAAKVLGMNVQRIDVKSGTDLDGAFAAASREHVDALFVFPLRVASPDSRRILEFALKNRMATLMWTKEGVEAGGLMSYGPNFRDHLRRAGIYLDKILKGTKPADLPVEQPTKFELVINLKTARALGLTIPRSLLSIADEVIQ
jgi:putative ABC transport system substrate-binding protein